MAKIVVQSVKNSFQAAGHAHAHKQVTSFHLDMTFSQVSTMHRSVCESADVKVLAPLKYCLAHMCDCRATVRHVRQLLDTCAHACCTVALDSSAFHRLVRMLLEPLVYDDN